MSKILHYVILRIMHPWILLNMLHHEIETPNMHIQSLDSLISIFLTNYAPDFNAVKSKMTPTHQRTKATQFFGYSLDWFQLVLIRIWIFCVIHSIFLSLNRSKFSCKSMGSFQVGKKLRGLLKPFILYDRTSRRPRTHTLCRFHGNSV